MAQKINIKAGKFEFGAELNDSPTAQKIADALEIRASGNRWGGEIYFAIPVKAELEPDNSREVLQTGELGYWPTGSAFCIFWGKTPASQGDEIRAASDVNIIGKITEGELSDLWDVPDGAEVVISKVVE